MKDNKLGRMAWEAYRDHVRGTATLPEWDEMVKDPTTAAAWCHVGRTVYDWAELKILEKMHYWLMSGSWR